MSGVCTRHMCLHPSNKEAGRLAHEKIFQPAYYFFNLFLVLVMLHVELNKC